MIIRKLTLNKPTVKALLALIKTRSASSDHALRPPVSPSVVYDLNTMLLSAEKLKSLLPDGLRYVIVGGIASAHYQPARFTEDIDLMVLAEDAAAVERALELAGWSQLGIISFGGSSWQSAEGELIDLLHAPGQSWVAAAIDTPIKTAEGLQIIDLPYLIILKLSATRAVDIGDIVGMLQHATEDETARIRQVIKTHRSDLIEDFEQFNAIAQLS
ncbi:MAG: hypothetical protein AAF716_06140 [Cyanobacteria bacterium P01_D01_bin.1]